MWLNYGADYGARTHELGFNAKTKQAVQTIADGAKLALEQLKAGNSEMAQAILANLSEWGGE